MKRAIVILVIGLCVLAALVAVGQQTPVLVTEEFTYMSSLDGTWPLYAVAVYPEGAKRLPLMVVQHGYWGNRGNVLFSAKRMAARGYFCVCLDTRGWGGSAGKHDDGGLEIMDIYDGMEAVAEKYPGKLDPARASIIGYSNGGANAIFAATRFPYRFRGAMTLFGIPDYGLWTKVFEGFRREVYPAVGGNPEQVPDKYLARNAILAAGNLRSGTHLHTAYDEEEGLCPIPMQEAYIKALQDAAVPSLTVHYSKKTDKERWIHGYNNGPLSPLEDRFMDDLEKNMLAAPVMPAAGRLTIIGFLITPRFRCFAGSGEDAAATVDYTCTPGKTRFTLTPLSSKREARARITLPTSATATTEVFVDNKLTATIKKGGTLQAEGTIGSVIEFRTR